MYRRTWARDARQGVALASTIELGRSPRLENRPDSDAIIIVYYSKEIS